MKKTFISFLIMTLLTSSSISLFNISSAYADTSSDNTTEASSDNSTVKVSLENIRDIMTENNSDIKILDNKLKIAKETYDDDKANLKTKPTKEEYTDSTTGVYNSTGYDNALKLYNDAETAYENAKTALKSARDSYDKGVENQVYAAQQAYITYLYDLSKKTVSEDTKKQNEKKEQIYKLQYESGFISKNKYTSLLQGNTSTNDLSSADNTADLDRIKLCNALGIGTEEKVTFNTDITTDFQVISKINYEDDLAKMLDNNLDIKMKNDDISDLEDEEDTYDANDQSDIYDYKLENVNMELQKLINDTKANFKTSYNDLMTSYNSVKSSYDVINQEQLEYKITQTKYDYGFISQNDLDAAKLTLDKDNAEFINKRNQCYLKYLKYIEMKEGY